MAVRVEGQTAARFEPVVRTFARLVGRREGGGALTVRLRGETVVDVWTGYADRGRTRPWTPDTLAISFSTTKGVASTIIHRLADRGQLRYDEPVASYWPEFAAGGKERVTVRHLLTHRAGLHSVRAVAPRAEDLLDHIGVPDEAREFVAEPVGAALRQFGVGANFTRPVWGRYRVSRTTIDALHVPGFHRLFEGSDPPIWHTEMPAVNGVVSAGALADLYAPLANGGDGFLSRQTVYDLGHVQVSAVDAVLGMRMRWRLGYHQAFGSGGRLAFGHYGYGGSGGWADPATGLSVGFVTNRIGSPTTPP